jgi:hypothetical protein
MATSPKRRSQRVLQWSSSVALSCLLLCSLGALRASAQQFKQPTVVATGNWPVAVYAADVNGDGAADLIVIDAGATATASTTRVLLNDGHGNFHQSTVLQTAGTSVAFGNILGNGHVDIAWLSSVAAAASLADTYSVAPGNGDGTFGAVQQTVTYPTYAGGQSQSTGPHVFQYLQAVQLHSTGPLDVVAEDITYGAFSDLCLQAGHFVNRSFNVQDIGYGPMTFADLTGNGRLDMVLESTVNHTATVLLNRNDNVIFAPGNYAYQAGNVYSTLFRDTDGDGIADMIAQGADGRLDVFHGDGDGTFATTSTGGSGSQNGASGNGGHLIAQAVRRSDGTPMLITQSPIGVASLLIGSASPTFVQNGIYNAGPGRASFAVADFNGDGMSDIAVDSPEGVAILYGNADGSFQTSLAYSASQPAYSVAIGQFTGSGVLDAVVATGVPQLQFLAGDGAGGFTSAFTPQPANAPETDSNRRLWSHIAVGDFDGDGKLDAAITLQGKFPAMATTADPVPDGLTIQFGNGDGTFAAPVQQAALAGSTHYGASAVGDFAGTGAVGIANLDPGYDAAYLGGAGARAGEMPRTVLYNDTAVDSSNGASPALIEPDSYNLIATGFLNPGRTTKPDVVVQDDNEFIVYQNNGDGTFFPSATAAAAGSATFSAPPAFHGADAQTGSLGTTGIFPTSLLLQDIDGDGYGDVAVLYHNLASDPAHPSAATPNQLYIYWGQGNRNFNATPTILTLDRNFYELAIADIDGDGTPDLVLSDGYMVAVLYGLGNHQFGREQHILAGMGINAIVTASLGRNGAQDIITANGGLTLVNPVVTDGALALNTEIYTGGITVLPNNAAPQVVTGTVVASPEPTQYGTAFTLTATLTPPANGASPEGTVTFSVDGASVGMAPVVSNAASLPVTAPMYTIGAHSLTAAYSGDGNYNAATFTGTHNITGLRSETFFTNATPTIYYGQVADGQGSVVAEDVAAGATIDGGSITFYDGLTAICMLPINGVQQTCPPSAGAGFDVGTHVLTAMYSGNQYYLPSTSDPSDVQVLPDDTAGTLASALNPSTLGQTVTFTAPFTAMYATPTGQVTFYDGTAAIGFASLNGNGVATFATSALAVGTHSITATLASSLNFNGSMSGAVQQIVLPVAVTPESTQTLLSSSVNPSSPGQNVIFSAQVTTTGALLFTPAGTVTFYDGSTALGTMTLNSSGIASFATTALALGTHNITAAYSGNPNGNTPTAASTSAMLQQVVTTGLAGNNVFALIVTPTNLSIGIGNTITISAVVTEPVGFNEPVTLSCNGLPYGTTCTFGTTTIAAGGGQTTLAISPGAPHDCDNTTPYFVISSTGQGAMPLLAFGVLCFFARKRRVLKGIVLLACLCVLPLISGCGNCTNLGTRPGTYSFTVTAVSQGATTITKTQTVKFTARA